MKTKTTKAVLTFKQAVELTPDIEDSYQPGLTALGSYNDRISVANTSKIEGSVDIDKATEAKYPSQNRWDFAFSYNTEVFFVEVHSANTSEVKTMLRKLQWLKDWLVQKAPEINKLKAKNKTPYIWIQSKNFQILKNSPQYRSAVTNNIFPVKILKLD